MQNCVVSSFRAEPKDFLIFTKLLNTKQRGIAPYIHYHAPSRVLTLQQCTGIPKQPGGVVQAKMGLAFLDDTVVLTIVLQDEPFFIAAAEQDLFRLRDLVHLMNQQMKGGVEVVICP